MRRARVFGSVVLSTLLSLVACGNSNDSNKGSSSGGSSASGAGGAAGKPTNSAAGTDITIGGGSSAGTAGSSPGDSCVETKQVGKLVPLDLFIMLDISSSMLNPTSSRANAPKKWDAVKGALKSFLSDPASDGLGVGIQYFPLVDPSVPTICTSDAQCGSHGPCFLKFCAGAAGFHPCAGASDCVTTDGDFGPCAPLRYCSAPINGELWLCHDADECETGQRCVQYNECSADHDYVCENAGTMCVTQAGANLGTCGTPNSECVHTASCDMAAYAQPAASIAPLPGNLARVTASIDAQDPRGDTPTSPALKGAIQAASTWATAHPDHTVVTLLATDGVPTECVANATTDPTGINGVRDVAAAGLAATPSISTFVIGVFGPDDTDARMNLNRIAMAGGSGTAFLVDTSGDVTQQFLQALNKIRASQLTCEYLLPEAPSGQQLDYNLVNVDFNSGSATERLKQVNRADACGSGQGWYYDQDPTQSTTPPTKIVICPATCTRLQAATQGSVQVALGCKTQVR